MWLDIGHETWLLIGKQHPWVLRLPLPVYSETSSQLSSWSTGRWRKPTLLSKKVPLGSHTVNVFLTILIFSTVFNQALHNTESFRFQVPERFWGARRLVFCYCSPLATLLGFSFLDVHDPIKYCFPNYIEISHVRLPSPLLSFLLWLYFIHLFPFRSDLEEEKIIWSHPLRAIPIILILNIFWYFF